MIEPTYSSKTCESCRHWHKFPANARNLGAPKIGQCRVAPPQMVTISFDPRGTQVESVYPQMPANFQACSLHVEVVDVEGLTPSAIKLG